MTWGNPPKLAPTKPKPGKKITPEQLAASGSEDGEQAALFCWAADSVGTYPELKYLYAIPNGGSRHIAEATNMVAGGVRSGVPDICLPACSKHWLDPEYKCYQMYAGCYIEMKIEKRRTQKDGGLSKEQLNWLNYLRTAGYYCAVCYGWQEAKHVLIEYIKGKL